ncbi:S8 family peptidase [Amycolatopsis keratiniphila]|uniref:Subtilisin-like serine protease n=1 Tax=Amycolatopsis keratiniphila TaxID=129921 RepID=R4SWQ4_9PSEU|nr:S8 family serine peptidase [Amycolatopsis keratiniphila]AGM04586.1 subtilisin-like serine protease [Amycolatopsis keratiniphila]
MSLLGRSLRAAVCAFVVLCGSVAAVATAEAEPSCHPQGRALRYVVAFDKGTSEAEARAAVADGCGNTTVYYPQIAVAVATSADPDFAGLVRPAAAFSAQAERLAVQRANGTSPARSAPARAELEPTDPAKVPFADRTGEQWDMRAIGADRAHSIEPGSRDVVVGVLDSGIDPTHPDLANALDPGKSAGCLTGAPDRNWAATTSVHGTHVAGVIAAADDGKGVTGVAPGVRIASVKVIDDRGYADPEAAVCGLMWAVSQGMAVTNSSYFVDPWSLSCAHADERGVVNEVMARAVEYATSAGTLNVAAATNEAAELVPSPRSGARRQAEGCQALPAGLRDVVAVSSVSEERVKAGYSSYGLGVIDVTAPGGEAGQCVLSTVPGGYAPLCGTSMAAPHVAGVAALLASKHPGYSARQLRRTLDAQATPIACPADYDLTGDGSQDAYCTGYAGFNGFYGHGMVDALAAVAPRRTGANPAR